VVPSGTAPIMIIIVVLFAGVGPIGDVLLLDGAGKEPFQLAAIEPDASALLADVDRHSVTFQFVEC
jgi:hypothetical protein